MKKLGLLAMPLMVMPFLVGCGKNAWWDNTDALTKEDIGKIEKIIVNGQSHRVRLIDVDHDDLAGGAQKAHTTWEFVDLLCDSNGYSIATPWDLRNGTSTRNRDFLNSNVRKALDGIGTGGVIWYEKGSTTQSTTYTTPVLNMLPTELRNVIKKVTKQVSIYENGNYAVKNYDTSLFILSGNEIAVSDFEKEEEDEHIQKLGDTYQFYKNDGDSNLNRIKHQIKGKDGAVNDSIDTKDLGDFDADNYAGFEKMDESKDYGSHYWTRSARVDEEGSNAIEVYRINYTGNLTNGVSCNDNLYPIAPAFCI